MELVQDYLGDDKKQQPQKVCHLSRAGKIKTYIPKYASGSSTIMFIHCCVKTELNLSAILPTQINVEEGRLGEHGPIIAGNGNHDTNELEIT